MDNSISPATSSSVLLYEVSLIVLVNMWNIDHIINKDLQLIHSLLP